MRKPKTLRYNGEVVMKNKLLKIISIFLVIIFMAALLPLTAVPASAGWAGEGAGTGDRKSVV